MHVFYEHTIHFTPGSPGRHIQERTSSRCYCKWIL